MIVLPAIADLQQEYSQCSGPSVHREFIRLRGYLAFWKAIGLYLLWRTEERMLRSIITNSVPIVVFFLLALLLVSGGQSVGLGWVLGAMGFTLASMIGLGVSLWMRARIAGLVTSTLTAYSVSELIVHGYYGIGAAQGAPTHFAVLGASIIGVALGALFATHRPRVAS